MSIESELDALGTALGGLRWVPGPGGNVSVKEDGTLYVKASGVRLRSVGSAYATVPLGLADRALAGDAEADANVFALTPRPSLETYFHALGPRVVAHTHPLGMLLLACANAAFVDVDAVRIPYERPGRGIAVSIQRAFGGGPVRGAVLLERHGLIVFAPSVDEAITRTRALDEQVRRAWGALPDVDAQHDAYVRAGTEVVLPSGARARSLPPRASSGRYLFPDAVVYASALQVDVADAATAERAFAATGRPVVIVDPNGARMAVAKNADQLAFALEVTCAHDWLEDVLEKRGLAHHLPDDEPARILDLPAEKYRLKL
ncbi:MAG: class II aldolase/adducin family protein [Polyangiaceae bacterium]